MSEILKRNQIRFMIYSAKIVKFVHITKTSNNLHFSSTCLDFVIKYLKSNAGRKLMYEKKL